MKIAILAAGDSSHYFPVLIDKPKCLYSLNGQIQLKKIIEDAKKIVDEKDIIIVTGYKGEKIKKYLKENKFQGEVKNNLRYKEASIYSFRKAIENVQEDMVFMFADESISLKNIKKISESKNKMSILYHDKYYYYSLGIFKFRKDILNIMNDDKYLAPSFLEEIYQFSNGKKMKNPININSGICIGYIMIDFIKRIENLVKIEYPKDKNYKNIDFIEYDPKLEYIPDLDYFNDTDEYKNSILMRIYFDYITKLIRLPKRILKKIKRIAFGEN